MTFTVVSISAFRPISDSDLSPEPTGSGSTTLRTYTPTIFAGVYE
jgi:hypothetical protein